jgi:aerobic-type carbon monoxide dehydrogenase small subunit (CoxS/CutS family)
MERITLSINQQTYIVNVDPDTPLLWVLRDQLGLTGTKYSCGIGQCGACTVHIDGQAQRSCLFPVEAVTDSEITTIEGLGSPIGQALQRAWVDLNVPQCGYCQPGQIMAVAALLEENPAPTDDDIDEAMQHNLCRCGTYQRIREAIRAVAEGAEA